MLLDFLSAGLFFEDQLAEFFLFSPQFCGSFSDLGVELSPCRVDVLCCIINKLGLIISEFLTSNPFKLIPDRKRVADSFQDKVFAFYWHPRKALSEVGYLWGLRGCGFLYGGFQLQSS